MTSRRVRPALAAGLAALLGLLAAGAAHAGAQKYEPLSAAVQARRVMK